jgi:hypothetical protein
MKALICVVAAVLAMTVVSARADCLDDVAQFADKVCAGARTIGKPSLINENGELNATAVVLITTAVAALGDNVSAETAAYEKTLQEQLSAERVSLRKCGIAMAKTAIDQICFKAH